MKQVALALAKLIVFGRVCGLCNDHLCLCYCCNALCAMQSHPGCAATFVTFLFRRIHDPNRPAITRTACAAYLASFLARAKFLPKHLLIRSLLDMARWCSDYCKTQDQRQKSPMPASSAFDMGVQHQVRDTDQSCTKPPKSPALHIHGYLLAGHCAHATIALRNPPACVRTTLQGIHL